MSKKERVHVGYKDASVWHCSLSLRAEEGALTDQQWGDIANDFVDSMGFTEASGKARCRWAAVNHGTSENGNHHIHLAVSLVREDGSITRGLPDEAPTGPVLIDGGQGPAA